MTSTARPGAPLTAAELRVINVLADDKTIDEAAGFLGLSAWTVKSHVGNAYVKLGVRDHASLMGAAILTGNLTVQQRGAVPERFDEQLWEVVVRIARGHPNRQIIDELKLSRRALQTQVRELLDMFGVATRAGLVVAAVACGAFRLVPARRSLDSTQSDEAHSGPQNAQRHAPEPPRRAGDTARPAVRVGAIPGPSSQTPTTRSPAKPLPTADARSATRIET